MKRWNEMEEQEVKMKFEITSSRKLTAEELLGMLEDCDSEELWIVKEVE